MGQKVHPLGFRLGITQKHKCQWFEEMKNYPNTVYQDYVLRNCLFTNFKDADITSINIERSLNQVVVKVTAARPKLLISNIDQVTKHLNALLKLMITCPAGFFESSRFTNNPCFAASMSINSLANTNITDVSLATLNKWNDKVTRSKKSLAFALKDRALLVSKIKGLEVAKDPEDFVQDDVKISFLSSALPTAPVDQEDDFFDAESVQENDPKLTLLIGSSSQTVIANSAFLTAKTIQEQLEKRVPFRRAVRVALRRGQTPKGIKIQISGRLNGAEIARSEWIRQGRVPLHTLRAQVDYCSHEAKTQYGILGIKVWIFQGYQD